MVFKSEDERGYGVMTREEAINVLKNLEVLAYEKYMLKTTEAIDMAISALEEATPKWKYSGQFIADIQEKAIELLITTGWLEKHDKEISRPNGEWEAYEVKNGPYGNTHWVCSECGHVSKFQERYCMSCGALMIHEEIENE